MNRSLSLFLKERLRKIALSLFLKKTEYLQKRQKVVNFGQFPLNYLFKKSDKRAIVLSKEQKSKKERFALLWALSLF